MKKIIALIIFVSSMEVRADIFCQRKNQDPPAHYTSRIQALKIVSATRCPTGYRKIGEVTSISDVEAISTKVFQTNINALGTLVGARGATGAQGPVGAQGAPGLNGINGAQGAQGPAGAQGLQGAQGPAGAQGAQGPQGAVGPRGATGANGAQGPAGAVGPQGPAGAAGAQGLRGAAGPQGVAGPMGPQGPQGPAGASITGPQGPVGPQGPAGPAGGSGSHPGSAPLRFEVYNSDASSWACVDVNLASLCGDDDGCRIDLLMHHETDGNDMVRAISEHIYMEQPSLSANRSPGIYGYTRQEGGGDHAWILGISNQYTIFEPWEWVYMLNYRHSYCPGQNGSTGPSYAGSDLYKFTIMSHPSVRTSVVVYDN
jgi:hypothetical protein